MLKIADNIAATATAANIVGKWSLVRRRCQNSVAPVSKLTTSLLVTKWEGVTIFGN